MALSILSILTPSQLEQAISQEAIASITAVKGIGKKLAQRIVLELKDKIMVLRGPETGQQQVFEEACLGLMKLGMAKKSAELALSNVLQQHPQQILTLEDWIKLALQSA